MNNRRLLLLLCLLLLTLCRTVPSSGAEPAEDAEFITLTLDPPAQREADVLLPDSLPGSGQPQSPPAAAPEASSRAASNGKLRIYSFGEPLQVERSYAESAAAAQEARDRAAAQLLLANAPEIAGSYSYSWNTSEEIHRYDAGTYVPIGERFSLGVFTHQAYFHLSEDTDDLPDNRNCDLYEYDLALGYRYDPQLSFAVVALMSGTEELYTPGARARAEYAATNGAGLVLSGRLWSPWADNAQTAMNNGRNNGFTMQGLLPLSRRITVSAEGALYWYFLAKDAFASHSFQGMQALGQSRLDWALWRVPGRELPVPFRDAQSLLPEGLPTGLSAFTNLLASTYSRRPDASPVSVTEHRFEQRLGLTGSLALNSHFGLSGDGYTGYDTERDIDMGKLYGFSTRLIYLATSRLRLHGEFGMDSEAANELAEGQTWRCGGGVNIKF